MKKEIKELKDGMVRITTTDERWYTRITKNEEQIPQVSFIPSVTWITGHYPKGIAFYKWLADKGWDESQALKQAAGDKGSKVHQAIEMLVAGEEIKLDGKILNPQTDNEEDLTVEEYGCLMSFADWANKVKPKFLKNEMTVYSDAYGYAGTVDCIAQIGSEVYIIDWKTSQYVWPEYELQLSAYKQAVLEKCGDKIPNPKLAILQVGYRKNRAGYKFTEIEDKFELFLAAKKIWANECARQKPLQKDYPLSLSLPFVQEELKKKEEAERESLPSPASWNAIPVTGEMCELSPDCHCSDCQRENVKMD
jgi:hypothetical protein